MHATVDISKYKNVCIIGAPASGKTYLSNLLAKDNPGHKLIHTDSYADFGYVEGLYRLLTDLRTVPDSTIIEGVLGYRLLRKGAETGLYSPDLVIELDTPIATIVREYAQNRPEKHIGSLMSFIKACQTVLKDYRDIEYMLEKKPQWIKLTNNY